MRAFDVRSQTMSLPDLSRTIKGLLPYLPGTSVRPPVSLISAVTAPPYLKPPVRPALRVYLNPFLFAITPSCFASKFIKDSPLPVPVMVATNVLPVDFASTLRYLLSAVGLMLYSSRIRRDASVLAESAVLLIACLAQ